MAAPRAPTVRRRVSLDAAPGSRPALRGRAAARASSCSAITAAALLGRSSLACRARRRRLGRRPAARRGAARARPRAARVPALRGRRRLARRLAPPGSPCSRRSTAAPHVAAGYLTVRGYSVLESVFADEEPRRRLADRGLFLATCRTAAAARRRRTPGSSRSSSGSARARWRRSSARARVVAGREARQDEAVDDDPPARHRRGPGQLGARTDTIILAAIQHGTGRAAAFGIPRNLAQVPLGGSAKPSKEPLNALYGLNGGGAAGRDARSSRRSRTCSGSASTTTRSSTCSASPTSSTRSEASRSTSRSGSSTR